MRRRSVQLSILIVIIVAISVAALGFRDININVPGFPALVRGGDGPLGLKLGLDLSGGGHLVYQADTGTRIEVGFVDPARGVVIDRALEGLGVTDYEMRQLDDRTYIVTTDLLEDTVKADLEESIVFSQLEFSFDPELELPESPTVSDVVKEQELADHQVEETGVDNFFRIRTTSILDEGQQGELQDALEEEIGDLADFSTETVGTVSFALSEIQPPTPDQMEGVLDRINRRVNLFGTEEPIIQLFGEDRVIVQLPGASGSISEVVFAESTDAAAVEGVVVGQGYEDFTVNAQSDTEYEIRTISLNVNQQSALRGALSSSVGEVSSFTTTGGIETAKALIGQTAQLVFKERTCSDLTCFEFTDDEIGLTGDDLESAFASTDPNTGEWEVNIAFGDRGTGLFSDLTQRIVGIDTKRIAVFLDDELLIAPVSLAWIRDGRSSITGNFSREEARTLAIQLEAGSLPVPLELIQESDVDALLGSESLKKSLQAGLIGLGLVLIFMIIYYRMAGVVARPGPGLLHLSGAGGIQAGARNPGPVWHRRLHPVHRSGGGRQHPDIRADERGDTHWPHPGLLYGGRVQPGLAGHPRWQLLHHHHLSGAAVAGQSHRRRPGNGLCLHPLHRRGGQHVHRHRGQPQPAAVDGLDWPGPPAYAVQPRGLAPPGFRRPGRRRRAAPQRIGNKRTGNNREIPFP